MRLFFRRKVWGPLAEWKCHTHLRAEEEVKSGAWNMTNVWIKQQTRTKKNKRSEGREPAGVFQTTPGEKPENSQSGSRTPLEQERKRTQFTGVMSWIWHPAYWFLSSKTTWCVHWLMHCYWFLFKRWMRRSDFSWSGDWRSKMKRKKPKKQPLHGTETTARASSSSPSPSPSPPPPSPSSSSPPPHHHPHHHIITSSYTPLLMSNNKSAIEDERICSERQVKKSLPKFVFIHDRGCFCKTFYLTCQVPCAHTIFVVVIQNRAKRAQSRLLGLSAW